MPFDQPEDRRYTDQRFPDLEIRNDGGPLFVVYEDGQPMDEFKAYETPGQPQVSEQFAARRAQQYYDRMGSGQLSAELLDRPDVMAKAQPNRLGVRNDTEPMGVEPEAAPPNRLNWTAKVIGPTATGQTHPTKGKLGSPLPPGGRFGEPKDLDALIARARETSDPNLWKQAGSWMAQESAAQRIVRLLLAL